METLNKTDLSVSIKLDFPVGPLPAAAIISGSAKTQLLKTKKE